jgi:hypothetical protein
MLCAAMVCAVGSALSGCGPPKPTALHLALLHPHSLAAAQYVTIHAGDLPSRYVAKPAPGNVESEDAAQTLAEYRCEQIDPPSGPAPISARTPDFTDPTGRTELHETTAVFSSAALARRHLDLELSPRYPSCKAAVFRSALVASAATGERVGFVTVHVSPLPARFGDTGVEVVGLSTLSLPGGISATATSDLAVLIRGPIVAELSIETDGETPTALLNVLTTDLADRLANAVPNE